jgi:hypothetical protein
MRVQECCGCVQQTNKQNRTNERTNEQINPKNAKAKAANKTKQKQNKNKIVSHYYVTLELSHE